MLSRMAENIANAEEYYQWHWAIYQHKTFQATGLQRIIIKLSCCMEFNFDFDTTIKNSTIFGVKIQLNVQNYIQDL